MKKSQTMVIGLLLCLFLPIANTLFDKLPEDTQQSIGEAIEALPIKQMTIPLFADSDSENKEFTTNLVSIPLLIGNIKLVDFAIGADYTRLKIWCEFRVGQNYVRFNFDDLTFSYHLEEGRLQADGTATTYGMTSFKVTFDTDGIITGSPKLVLYYL